MDGAEVVLYGVSEAYKESANCRLVRAQAVCTYVCCVSDGLHGVCVVRLRQEAMYAHKQQIEVSAASALSPPPQLSHLAVTNKVVPLLTHLGTPRADDPTDDDEGVQRNRVVRSSHPCAHQFNDLSSVASGAVAAQMT